MRVVETKERILDAAERLFAREGYAAASLRAVTAEAAVNLAAVNYHFGSKEALLRAVLRRIIGPVNAERLRLLDALEATGVPPSPEALLDAFITPDLDLLDRRGEGGRLHALLLGRLMGDPGEDVRRMVGEEIGEVLRRYLHAFTRALPDVPPAEVWWRFKGAIGVLVFLEANTLTDDLPDAPAAAGDTRARLLAFLAPALRAPAPPAATPP